MKNNLFKNIFLPHKNNLIFEKQFGFRTNYSTNHIIDITELIESGNHVSGVFVDLKKAFDTVFIIRFYVINLTIMGY